MKQQRTNKKNRQQLKSIETEAFFSWRAFGIGLFISIILFAIAIITKTSESNGDLPSDVVMYDNIQVPNPVIEISTSEDANSSLSLEQSDTLLEESFGSHEEIKEIAQTTEESEIEKTENNGDQSQNGDFVDIEKPLTKPVELEESQSDSIPEKHEALSIQTYPFSEEEIGLLVQMIQHEVGYRACNFPGYDFDYIQQCMARVILNRIGRRGFPDTIKGILLQENQFVSDLSDISSLAPDEETTLKNLMVVIRNEDGISSNLFAEMSFNPGTTIEDAVDFMQSQMIDTVLPYYSAITADGRLLLFGEVC